MPVATPLEPTDEQLALVSFNDDGLVPAIVQEEGTGKVLMMAWMNEESLRRTSGNRSRAARLLRVSRKTLYARMRRLGIAPPPREH